MNNRQRSATINQPAHGTSREVMRHAPKRKGGAKLLLVFALVLILSSGVGLVVHISKRGHRTAAPSTVIETDYLSPQPDLQGTLAQIDRAISAQGEAEFLGASQEEQVSSYFFPCSPEVASEKVTEVFVGNGWKELGLSEPGELIIFGRTDQEDGEPDRAMVMFVQEDGGCSVVLEFLEWGSVS